VTRCTKRRPKVASLQRHRWWNVYQGRTLLDRVQFPTSMDALDVLRAVKATPGMPDDIRVEHEVPR
jgi:hypothetical protein